jgi:hypothetical protein
MKTAAYVLSSITFAACAILLLRGYTQSRQRLLLWSGLCFFGLGLSNLFVFVDLVLLPDTDLYLLRLGTAAVSMMLLMIGLLREGE